MTILLSTVSLGLDSEVENIRELVKEQLGQWKLLRVELVAGCGCPAHLSTNFIDSDVIVNDNVMKDTCGLNPLSHCQSQRCRTRKSQPTWSTELGYK